MKVNFVKGRLGTRANRPTNLQDFQVIRDSIAEMKAANKKLKVAQGAIADYLKKVPYGLKLRFSPTCHLGLQVGPYGQNLYGVFGRSQRPHVNYGAYTVGRGAVSIWRNVLGVDQ